MSIPFIELAYPVSSVFSGPDVIWNSPKTGDAISSFVTFQVTGNQVTQSVEFIEDGSRSLGFGTRQNGTDFYLNFYTGFSSDGTHVYSAVARDGSGNSSTKSVTLEVTNGVGGNSLGQVGAVLSPIIAKSGNGMHALIYANNSYSPQKQLIALWGDTISGIQYPVLPSPVPIKDPRGEWVNDNLFIHFDLSQSGDSSGTVYAMEYSVVGATVSLSNTFSTSAPFFKSLQSCSLNGIPICVWLEFDSSGQGTNQGKIRAAYRTVDSGVVHWKTFSKDITTPGVISAYPSTCVAFNGFAYYFFTEDSTATISMAKFYLDGSNTLQLSTYGVWISDTSPESPSGEVAVIKAVKDGANNRIILIYQALENEETHCLSGLWTALNTNYASDIVVAVGVDDIPHRILTIPWKVSHTNFTTRVAVPDSTGISLLVPFDNTTTCNISDCGIQAARFTYSSSQLSLGTFYPGAPATQVYAYAFDGWYVRGHPNQNNGTMTIEHI